jgi:hypothetical protein
MTTPWMFQTHLADAKIKQYVAALQTIAGQEQCQPLCHQLA